MSDKYDALSAAIESAGFFACGIEQRDGWDRTTLCTARGHNWCSGHSFWVTQMSDGWYAGTWGGLIFRIPNSDDVVRLCIKWLTRHPHKIVTDFDDDIKQEFGLIEVSEDEF